MKEITTHHVNGLNESIRITVLDEPGPGGACHLYRLELKSPATRKPDETGINPNVTLRFQNGPIKGPEDFNGLTNEALLAVLIHRMNGFATGPFACVENTDALAYLNMAATALAARTKARLARGVEGSNTP